MASTLKQMMRVLPADAQRRVEQRAADLITLEYVRRSARSRALRLVDSPKTAPVNAFTPP